MKVEILGCSVDMVDMEESLKRVEDFISEGSPHHIITLNAEIIYKAQAEEKLKNIINTAHLVTPDGAGVLWAAKELNKPLRERVTGIDLTQKLASKASEKGWRLFFYGAPPGVAAKAAEKLSQEYPDLQIAGVSHGYLDDEEKNLLLEEIREKKPHILFVALGAPNQEYWIRERIEDLNVPILMGVGGSFDVISGEMKRAPQWMQKTGLEWAYRLLADPKRIKRFIALPLFMWKLKTSKGKKAQ